MNIFSSACATLASLPTRIGDKNRFVIREKGVVSGVTKNVRGIPTNVHKDPLKGDHTRVFFST